MFVQFIASTVVAFPALLLVSVFFSHTRSTKARVVKSLIVAVVWGAVTLLMQALGIVGWIVGMIVLVGVVMKVMGQSFGGALLVVLIVTVLLQLALGVLRVGAA